MIPLLILSLLQPPRDTPGVVQPGAELYPADARAAKVEGDVNVHLDIGADGSIRCTSPAPDKLAALKRASCELVVRRDIFPPRFDKAGKAVATTLDLTVRWRLNADMAQFGGAIPIGRTYWIRHGDYPYQGGLNLTGGQVRVAFEISPTGRVEHCKVTHTMVNLTLDALACSLLEKRAALLPALDANGQPRRTSGTFIVLWRNTPLSEDFSMEDPFPPDRDPRKL